MRVSILVPVYKSESFIKRCCVSLFSQTFEDIEYIFVDDCSPDKSISVVRQCLRDYPSRQNATRVIQLDENKGVAFVRNLLLKEAQGEYLLFVDSDDWIEVNAVEILYNKAHEKNADVVSFGFYCENENRTTQRSFHYECKDECLQDVIGNNWGVVWRFLFRNDLVKNNLISFPQGLQGGEDYVFCVKTIFYALNIISLNHSLYHYVTYNSGSLISTKNIDSIVHQYKATAIVEDFLKTQDKYHLYTNALNERKYYVMSLFKSFFGARYGNLIITKYKCRYKFYFQKIKNLSRLVFNK